MNSLFSITTVQTKFNVEFICQGSCLFLVSSNPVILLGLRPPITFPLRPNRGSAIRARLRSSVRAVVAYVPVEGRAVYLILLKSHDVLVKLLSTLNISHLVKGLRIRDVGSVKLKVRRVIDKKLFRRNLFTVFRYFTHDFPSSTLPNNRTAPFIANATEESSHVSGTCGLSDIFHRGIPHLVLEQSRHSKLP
jgi:hypothetical protein